MRCLTLIHLTAIAALLVAVPLTARGQQRPGVVVITTGGTIAGSPGGALSGDSLVGAVPELLEHANVSVEEIYRIGSSQMTPNHWLSLAKRVNELLRADPDLSGIVITHGTDTLEETAFFLNLTVRDPRPVVMVGAMRTADAISADGPGNLLNAVRVAVSPEAVGKGVLVVLNEDIGAARDIWKTHNQRVETFRSPELGFLGYVDPDEVVFHRETLRPHTTGSPFDVTGLEELPRVDIVSDYAGSDGRILTNAAEQAPDGIVVITFAGGRMSAGTQMGLQAAVAAGVPVVIASRVPGGRIVGNPAERFGALQSSDLPANKTRILLMLGLTQTTSPSELQRILDLF